MKKLNIAVLLFSGAALFYACNGNSSSTSSSDSTTTTSTDTSTGAMSNADTSKMDTSMAGTSNTAGNAMVDDNTKDFVKKAATGGMEEVELGRLAQQKASSQRVKNFGQMMVDDHSKANDQLKTIATQKNIDIPAAVTDDQRKDIDMLSKKSGTDFDKAYVDMMVNDHKKDIDEFKKAQAKVNDNDIKNFAINTLPTLQKHLDSIQAIKAKK
jgi:putative membrane protein